MQLKNFLLAASLALSASAASTTNGTEIAPYIQNRLATLELGYIHTNIQLDQLAAGSDMVDADDVVKTYLGTIAAEDNALDKPQPAAKALSTDMQLTLCQAFHSLTLTGIRLDGSLVDNMNQFNATQQGEIMKGINRVSKETSTFVKEVGAKALAYCGQTIALDNKALGISFDMVKEAYMPSN